MAMMSARAATFASCPVVGDELAQAGAVYRLVAVHEEAGAMDGRHPAGFEREDRRAGIALRGRTIVEQQRRIGTVTRLADGSAFDSELALENPGEKQRVVDRILAGIADEIGRASCRER